MWFGFMVLINVGGRTVAGGRVNYFALGLPPVQFTPLLQVQTSVPSLNLQPRAIQTSALDTPPHQVLMSLQILHPIEAGNYICTF